MACFRSPLGVGRQIQQEIRKKERTIEYFAKKYESTHLTEDDIRLCLYSICDNNSFLNSNRYIGCLLA